MRQSLRQAVGVLLHRPWYTASIVAVMAVGFALLASVLAVVDGVLFKPLGYPNESQLVSIGVESTSSSWRRRSQGWRPWYCCGRRWQARHGCSRIDR